MSTRKIPLALGEFYHVYNRGNSKQLIYNNDSEYKRFQNLLYIANGTKHFEMRELKMPNVLDFKRGEPLVAIGLYCLMPNHFHILLTPVVEDGIQQFMKKLSTSYSMYFNKKNLRTGSLFEGKFKSRHIDSDEYLKYLFSYIHLNPVKLIDSKWREEGIKDAEIAFEYISKYKFSSLQDYLGVVRNENKILDKKKFPEYFNSNKDIKKELFQWLAFKPDIL